MLPNPYTTEATILDIIDASPIAGTSADIQALIGGSSNGVVEIPPGTWRIDNPILLPAGMRLQGAGMLGTILFRNPTTFADYGSLVQVSGSNPNTWVDGLVFVGERGGNGSLNANRNIGLQLIETQDFRVSNCYFGLLGFAGVDARGIGGTQHPTGVIDNCLLVRNYKFGATGTTANDSPGYGVAAYGCGDLSWQGDAVLGGPDAVFVEDCVSVLNRHFTAANNGAHMVVRFNRVYDHIISHPIDAHGGSFGSQRGTRTLEVYRNVIDGPITSSTGGIFHTGFAVFRGGGGVVFGNIVSQFARCGVRLMIDGASEADYRAQGYPAKDQVQSLHVWGNDIFGGAPSEPSFTLASDYLEATHFRLNRDYFIRQPENYVPHTYPHPLRNEQSQQIFVPSSPAAQQSQLYTINASAQSGGGIYPSGLINVQPGEIPVVVPMPGLGNVVSALVIDGVSSANFGSFTFDGLGWAEISNFNRWIEKPHASSRTIVAKFKAASTNTKTITASAGAGGSIFPSGTTKVARNCGQGYIIVPDTGKTIADVLLDGASIGPQAFVDLRQVITDRTIEVVFA